MRSLFVIGALLAACADSADPVAVCQVQATSEGGSVEVGVGNEFTSIADGEEVQVELGLQGLYMFVANARVRDMSIGSDSLGAISIVAMAESGSEMLSLEVGCRDREFVDDAGGARLETPYWVALRPELSDSLDGRVVRLRATVRDRDGHEAFDERTIVARMPML